MSYREEDGLCVAEVVDGEVSSGSLSCHSQSATPFCQTREQEGRSEAESRGTRGSWVPQGSLPWSPQGSPGPSTAADFQFFFELHATSSRSNSLLRPPPPPPSPLSLPLLLLFLLLLASIPLRFHSSCFCALPCRLPCPSQAMRRLYEVTSGRVEANSENLDRGST